MKAASTLLSASVLLLTTATALAQEPAAPAAPPTPPAPGATEAQPPAVGGGEPAPVATGTIAEAPPPAEEPTRPVVPHIAVNGFVSGSYSYNFNQPFDRKNGFRAFDDDDQTLRVDVAELVFQHPVGDPGSLGFRVDLAAGSAIPRLSASAGLLGGADIDLQQAFVSYIFPGTSGVRLDFGKFITHMGAEVIEGYDGYNDNYTRSFSFFYGIPFTHTGLKVSKTFSEMVSASFLLVNGWDVARDNNDTLTLGAQVVVTPSPQFQAYLNIIGGAERAGSSDLRNAFNLVLIAKPSDKISLVLEGLFGTEAGLVPDPPNKPKSATWYSADAYAKAQLSNEFALTLRAELFGDPDGVRTGTAQSLIGVTLTPSYMVAPGFVLRADLRYDKSNPDVDGVKVFHTDDMNKNEDNQFTFAVNALASF